MIQLAKTSLVLVLAFCSSGCVHPPFPYLEGPFSGRVVDADNNEGVAGAFIVLVRKSDHPRMDGGPSTEHARETRTDAEGSFHFSRKLYLVANPFAWLLEPQFAVFKPGYSAYRLGSVPADSRFILRRLSGVDELRKYTSASDIGIYNCGWTLRDHVLRWEKSNGHCIYAPDVLDLILSFNENRKAVGLTTFFKSLKDQCLEYRGDWIEDLEECRNPH